MSTLLISEQDKLNILKQYGLLVEQEELLYPMYAEGTIKPIEGLEILEKACYVGMFLGPWGGAICTGIYVIKSIADGDTKGAIITSIFLAVLYRAKIITGILATPKKLLELSKMIKTGKPQTVIEENILKAYNKNMPNILTYIKNGTTKDIAWFKQLLKQLLKDTGLYLGIASSVNIGDYFINSYNPESTTTKPTQTNFKYTKNNPLILKNDNFSYYADGYDNNKKLKVFTKKNNTNNWIEVGVNTPEYNSIINKYGKYLKEKNEQA